MKFNAKILFLSSLIICPSRTKTSETENILAFVSMAAVGTTCWAIYERYSKNRKAEQVDRLEKIISDESFLVNLKFDIENLNKKYHYEFLFLKPTSDLDQDKFKPFVEIIQAKNQSISQIYQTLTSDIKFVCDFENKIQLKFKNNVDKQLLNDLKSLKSDLLNYEKFLNAGRFAFEFEILVRNLTKKYENEIKLANSNTANYYLELEAIIKLKQNSLFPFADYCEQLSNELLQLKSLPNKATGYGLLTNQDSHWLISALEYTLKNIVCWPRYEIEKKEKIEHEQKQRWLDVQIKEKEAKIENEKKAAQAKLEKEKNKARTLANQQAELERQRQQLILREREINLELMRIRDGQTIKEAIATKEQQCQQKIVQNKAEAQKEINKLQEEINRLRLDLGKNSSLMEANRQEAERAKFKISRMVQALQKLKSEVNALPVNPESVDGLPEYVSKLNSNLTHMENILAL